ncbi:hypothetical protein Dda_8685 [Drechslerella dactyloides]|uniref:Rrn9 domain-containing protein n=1 Tax=Drechslerella dactyloides TaxID=74499 RepID=A0AAD6IR19_DREDA|nr:hypothetical protein Dda_8685 [Drechslerella dactyloides]
MSAAPRDSSDDKGPCKHDRLVLDEQRQLLQSLDDRLREDLAQHLLLTFHLNCYFRKAPRHLQNISQTRVQPTDETLGRNDGKKKTSKASSVPSRQHRWRAWPLQYNRAARLESADNSPDLLQECITATMLRIASSQMRRRDDEHAFSADDELSARVCVPATQCISAALDRLIVGLYRSREGYAANEAIQDPEASFRKRIHYFNDKGDDEAPQLAPESPNRSYTAIKRRKAGRKAADSSLNWAYKQGSQRLLSHTDVFQHAMIQSFPHAVLQRAATRLEKIFHLPNDGDHSTYMTLTETKSGHTQVQRLNPKGQGTKGTGGMESLNGIFLETDATQAQFSDKVVSRSLWEAWTEDKLQAVEGGCFDRDGYLEKIPEQGWTAKRRRNYQAKRRRELETHNA